MAGACQGQGQNKGSGHLWPALAGERAEHQIATGSRRGAALWASMAATASGVGLVPEQAWENDEPGAVSLRHGSAVRVHRLRQREGRRQCRRR